jgi:MYXO-CTERM domain-containing protein
VAARVAGIEKEEGKKVADMVAFDVTAAVGEDAQVWHLRLDDAAPTGIDLVVRDAKAPTSVGGGAPLGSMAVAGVLVVAMLAAARRRFRRTYR